MRERVGYFDAHPPGTRTEVGDAVARPEQEVAGFIAWKSSPSCALPASTRADRAVDPRAVDIKHNPSRRQGLARRTASADDAIASSATASPSVQRRRHRCFFGMSTTQHPSPVSPARLVVAARGPRRKATDTPCAQLFPRAEGVRSGPVDGAHRHIITTTYSDETDIRAACDWAGTTGQTAGTSHRCPPQGGPESGHVRAILHPRAEQVSSFDAAGGRCDSGLGAMVAGET